MSVSFKNISKKNLRISCYFFFSCLHLSPFCGEGKCWEGLRGKENGNGLPQKEEVKRSVDLGHLTLVGDLGSFCLVLVLWWAKERGEYCKIVFLFPVG